MNLPYSDGRISLDLRADAEIKAGLKSIGKPIPENDIWIAAVAMQYDLTLITRDSHFQHVVGLIFERI